MEKIEIKKKQKQSNLQSFGCIFLIILLLVFIKLPGIIKAPDARKRSEFLRSIRYIHIAIEEYRKINGEYPESIEQQINSELIDRTPITWPTNPFAKKMSRREIQIGDSASVGDLSYIPIKTNETIDKFTLIGYGNINRALDLDQDGLTDNVLFICEEDNICVTEESHLPKLKRLKQYQEWFCEK